MGGASSANYTQTHIDGNSKIIIEAMPTTNIGRPKIDALQLILCHATARDSFIAYAKKDLSGFEIISDIEKLRSLNSHQIADWARDIMDNHQIRSDYPLQNMVLHNSAELLAQEACPIGNQLIEQIEQNMNEIIILLILKKMHGYLQSNEFKSWCSIKGNTAYCKPPTKNQSNYPTSAPITDCIMDSWQVISAQSNTSSNQLNAHIDDTRLSKILYPKYWLSVLSEAFNLLPISVTIADADSCNPGFPLIFANRAFEEMTGYTFDEIKGLPNNFLQGIDTEAESVRVLSSSLQNAVPAKVAITIYHKNGSPFLNVMSINPAFDRNSKYCFVIGIQFNCTSPAATVAQMVLVETLIKLLPGFCPLWKSI